MLEWREIATKTRKHFFYFIVSFFRVLVILWLTLPLVLQTLDDLVLIWLSWPSCDLGTSSSNFLSSKSVFYIDTQSEVCYGCILALAHTAHYCMADSAVGADLLSVGLALPASVPARGDHV